MDGVNGDYGLSDKHIEHLVNGPTQKEIDQKNIRNVVSALIGCGFESVQIFCTKFKPGEGDTMSYCDGYGNWYSRYGQVTEWLGKCEAVHFNDSGEERGDG